MAETTAWHLDADGTFILQTAGGENLSRIIVNKAGTGSTLTVHDGDSGGRVIAVVDTTVVGSLTYDLTLYHGLTVVAAGAGAADVTVTVGPAGSVDQAAFLADTGLGGDLSGTLPTPEVVRIRGVAVSGIVVSGSRGGNAALASLLTALASYHLITDSTS